MKNVVTGKITGNTIQLDEIIPRLEGRRVNVTIEPTEEEIILSKEENAQLWSEWQDQGHQGPIKDVEIPVS